MRFHKIHSRYKDVRAIKRKKPVKRVVRKKATKAASKAINKLFK